MAGDSRNTKVVAALVAAMTVGATGLLALEGGIWRPADRPVALTALADSRQGIREVLIFLASADVADQPALFDCLVYPDGRCTWRPRSALVRMAVVASEGESVTDSQKEALLAVLGRLSQAHNLTSRQIRLDSGSDDRITPGLPVSAGELRRLLTERDIIR